MTWVQIWCLPLFPAVIGLLQKPASKELSSWGLESFDAAILHRLVYPSILVWKLGQCKNT